MFLLSEISSCCVPVIRFPRPPLPRLNLLIIFTATPAFPTRLSDTPDFTMSSSDKASTKDRVDVHETPDDASTGGVDTAWKYLDAHRDASDAAGPIDLAALRRKIDWHIVPLMFLCYTLQFLDKVILNVSGHASRLVTSLTYSPRRAANADVV